MLSFHQDKEIIIMTSLTRTAFNIDLMINLIGDIYECRVCSARLLVDENFFLHGMHS